ncbi:MAG: hypothetical protein AB1595_04620, partial [bacterium]
KGEIDKAFQIMANIESWHEIFPHIYKKKVKILKKEGNKLFFEFVWGYNRIHYGLYIKKNNQKNSKVYQRKG